MSTPESIIKRKDLTPKWRFEASEIVGEEAAAEAQQGTAVVPNWSTTISWPDPWRLGAADIVSKEASAVEGTQQGTDPKHRILWHTTQLIWNHGASEIVGEEASEAAKRPSPLGWHEPWRLGAAEIVGKGASAEGTQKTSSD